MSHFILLFLAGISAVLVAGASYFMLRVSDRDVRVIERTSAAQGVWTAKLTTVETNKPKIRSVTAELQECISLLGRLIMSTGILPGRTKFELEQTLMSSGFRGPNALALFIGSKLVLVSTMPFIGWFLTNYFGISDLFRMACILGLGVVGLIAPDFVVRRIRRRYLSNLEEGLPDALDLLTICAQAGLSLEPGMSRVAFELLRSRPEVALEFAATVRELEILSDSSVALANLGKRTGLESLKRLTSALIQTIQYGTPLSDALRTLSNEMRQMSLTRFEERAARLPVLLTLPMILFILPCIFIVVGGPAGIQVAKSLSK